jgi:hypothetical protein
MSAWRTVPGPVLTGMVVFPATLILFLVARFWLGALISSAFLLVNVAAYMYFRR